jgi:hypothetical protein
VTRPTKTARGPWLWLLWLALIGAQNFDSSAEPIRFISETVGARNAFDRTIALKHIESDAPLQLAQANRTEMQRTPITFGEVI